MSYKNGQIEDGTIDEMLPEVIEGEDTNEIAIEMAKEVFYETYFSIPSSVRGILEGTANCFR